MHDHSHHAADKSKIYESLRKKGQRLTEQKKMIIDVFLENPDRMLSVAEICGHLEHVGEVDTATVYRNIQRFLEIGLFESMVDSGGFGRYMICSAGHHHHHFICTNCGAVIGFPCEKPFWEEAAREAGFTEERHSIEVFGVCAECKK